MKRITIVPLLILFMETLLVPAHGASISISGTVKDADGKGYVQEIKLPWKQITKEKHYATGDQLLYDLEHYIYHSGYGPTNETLGKYIRDLFVQMIPPVEIQSSRVSTQVITPSTRRSPKL